MAREKQDPALTGVAERTKLSDGVLSIYLPTDAECERFGILGDDAAYVAAWRAALLADSSLRKVRVRIGDKERALGKPNRGEASGIKDLRSRLGGIAYLGSREPYTAGAALREIVGREAYANIWGASADFGMSLIAIAAADNFDKPVAPLIALALLVDHLVASGAGAIGPLRRLKEAGQIKGARRIQSIAETGKLLPETEETVFSWIGKRVSDARICSATSKATGGYDYLVHVTGEGELYNPLGETDDQIHERLYRGLQIALEESAYTYRTSKKPFTAKIVFPEGETARLDIGVNPGSNVQANFYSSGLDGTELPREPAQRMHSQMMGAAQERKLTAGNAPIVDASGIQFFTVFGIPAKQSEVVSAAVLEGISRAYLEA
ncbi:MAG: hypothetical protein V1820_04280 [archaeon]